MNFCIKNVETQCTRDNLVAVAVCCANSVQIVRMWCELPLTNVNINETFCQTDTQILQATNQVVT